MGNEFIGKIVGIVKFGVFVWFDEFGVDGLVFMCELGCEYFNFDKESNIFIGLEIG